jgi:CspA family cold shock protein
MSSYNGVVTPNASSEHLLGRVKWFNNKAGYGFITVTDGGRSGTDVFVHHSAINVENQQFKYLVQGEYVEFELNRVESDAKEREFQASNVSGIKGGKLMCETRNELRSARNDYKNTKHPESANATPVPKQRGGDNRVSNSASNKKGWTLVGDKGKPDKRNGESRVKTQPTTQVKTIKADKGVTITIQSK